VDEFQNFATDSFATILSEARKYALNLTVANQYISQMSETVRDAVFGNVGTIVCFRISPDDAPFLQKYFEPQFEAPDLIQQHSRFFVTTMMINDEKAPAFSAKTLNLPSPPEDPTDRIVSLSRERYAQERQAVEEIVRRNAGLDDIPAAQPQQVSQPAKPKTQAQLETLDKIDRQTAANDSVKKAVGSNILQALTGAARAAEAPDSPKKRRRGKRGGKKNRKAAAAVSTSEASPAGQQGEEVIHLR
jgi:hypothetical protein